MKLIRRVAATLLMAVIAAIGVRLGGKGGTPRQHGGWKPIDLDRTDAMDPINDPIHDSIDKVDKVDNDVHVESVGEHGRVPVAAAAIG